MEMGGGDERWDAQIVRVGASPATSLAASACFLDDDGAGLGLGLGLGLELELELALPELLLPSFPLLLRPTSPDKLSLISCNLAFLASTLACPPSTSRTSLPGSASSIPLNNGS
ncbi:hypothetical protein EPUS_06571 [Endocarpon pusillum Z07020]|uniref:Uncharacterized protein n=1 Tax=Endocarpon pusillum (strain Z07020 / HMAS-L-300199) TaxID=1263415 RepID=U1HRI3_ENDPU|nr:uncharacterized protein EPUS_06571 [Endocarpon pusillum Z07020]ERF73110.1 hypothetical protein EPUS_06571 [Endocarpon pusillum Z07020]